jgi:predicted GH43/DUF377 family glycosyl hydrolase
VQNPTFLSRNALTLRPDPARVVLRPFGPATEPREQNPIDRTRANHIVDRVMALSADAAEREFAEVIENFRHRHRDLLAMFEARADDMEPALARHGAFTQTQRRLVGAYFLHEYSFEAAALFNPSIVPHLDQSTAPPGGLRFVLSLRAVGEGHVSSLTFRSGTIAADGVVTADPAVRCASVPKVRSRIAVTGGEQVEVAFDAGHDLSERVIFPVTSWQANGIEDARFVAFDEADGRVNYATYTAYSGSAIRSEMIETRDFVSFRMLPLEGAAAANKGMALFPRRIDGKYTMVARQDNENLHLVQSEDLLHWDSGRPLMSPKYPWEFVQIGNCGSPIELDEGWLMFTHGVGPVRRYAIGAVLLDRDDPGRVLARSRRPIIQPEENGREGYVPNVVYSCGALKHAGMIVLPFAVSDTFCNFATINTADLLETLEPCGT